MRVLFLITRADAVGGASIHTRDISRRLINDGNEVLVGIGGKGAVTEALTRENIPYKSLTTLKREVNVWSDIMAFFEIARLIMRFNPDLVSTHTSKVGFLGRIVCWLLGKPVLYTPHCWSFVEGFPKAKLYKWLEKIAAPFGTKIIAVSEAERQEGIAASVVSANAIVRIHNGMPDIEWNLISSQGANNPCILMVGRCEEQKDHTTLLKALSLVVDLDWNLRIAGDGPLESKLMKLAVELGIKDRIEFLGYRNDIENLMAESQIFVLITHWESFPRSILEAMRAGLPVITTGVGGTGESVEDGKTGYVIGKSDIEGLAVKIRNLLESDRLRSSFGVAGRSRYEDMFTFDRMYKKTIELYQSIVM